MIYREELMPEEGEREERDQSNKYYFTLEDAVSH